jgi:hypothetical protein
MQALPTEQVDQEANNFATTVAMHFQPRYGRALLDCYHDFIGHLAAHSAQPEAALDRLVGKFFARAAVKEPAHRVPGAGAVHSQSGQG